jgi:hypothetical protein
LGLWFLHWIASGTMDLQHDHEVEASMSIINIDTTSMPRRRFLAFLAGAVGSACMPIAKPARKTFSFTVAHPMPVLPSRRVVHWEFTNEPWNDLFAIGPDKLQVMLK